MFTSNNQNQQDNIAYFNGLNPMWANQSLKGNFIYIYIKFYIYKCFYAFFFFFVIERLI